MIYHLISAETWQAAKTTGIYQPDSLESEGFIHFSTAEQVAPTANRFYAGRDDMLLLAVPLDSLDDKLVFEDTYGHGMHPHLYCPLDTAKVLTVHTIQRDENGDYLFDFLS